MELPLWQILVLAVVQGVTEFLPISSSGHVVIVAALLAPQEGKLPEVGDVNIVLHMGTLFSIVVFYWRRIWELLLVDRRTIGMLVVGTLPAVAAGVPLKLFFEQALESPLLAGCLLPLTGLILLAASRVTPTSGDYREMSFGRGLLIGVAQACAILPGLSRSGTTISAGLASGLSPRSAATFSFLLAIPAIGGAGVLEARELLKEASLTTPLGSLALGALLSFAVGLASLWLLSRILERGKLQWFAWWCIPAGIGVIIWHLVRG